MGAVTHEGLIDLAAARVGGRALVASDEFFAPRDNLLAVARAVFIEGKYTDRGKWMDGWETRRRRGPEGGYDWCIIRLGIPGAIRVITVDTTHFRGNHPAACSLDAAQLSGKPGVSARALRTLDRAFVELLPRSPLAGDTENEFALVSDAAYTHVRLRIYPDGGVARLRIWGEARPDWRRIAAARRRPRRGGTRRRAARHERSILQRAVEPDHAGTVPRHGRRVGDAPPPGPRARLGGAAPGPARRDRARRPGHDPLQGQFPREREFGGVRRSGKRRAAG